MGYRLGHERGFVAHTLCWPRIGRLHNNTLRLKTGDHQVRPVTPKLRKRRRVGGGLTRLRR